MINMINSIIKFGLILAVAVGIVFCIHLFVLSFFIFALFDNRIIVSYAINYILALGIYVSLYKFRVKYLDILGFIFMAGSFLKFAIFFIFFNPIYKVDGVVTVLEATSFLIPYIVCLFFETFYLIKLLNNKV